jgi:hypothetical protein
MKSSNPISEIMVIEIYDDSVVSYLKLAYLNIVIEKVSVFEQVGCIHPDFYRAMVF